MQIFNYELKFGPNERLINLTTLKIKMVFTWQKKKLLQKLLENTVTKVKKQLTEKKIASKGLIFQIYKELLKIKEIETKNLIT